MPHQTSASAPSIDANLALIAKIRPVNSVIGCTPQMSYAIRLNIERLTNEISIGSKVSKDALPPIKFVGADSFRKFLSSLIDFSWFSKIIVVTNSRL